MRRIETLDHIAQGLDALLIIDPRLGEVHGVAGDVPLRLSDPGFASLVSIIVSQQVSRASTQAMLRRLTALAPVIDPAALIAGGEDMLRAAGLSRPKQRTILAVARAVEAGDIDLAALCEMEAQEAMARMTALHGIGPWTAEVYLLFAAGHPDIFPARDVALQNAVARAFGLDPRPGEKALMEIAAPWAPWRGVAARLFWSYHHAIAGRSAAPVIAPAGQDVDNTDT